MDAVDLARLQFGFTIGFHFIFPTITIGLAWLVVLAETLGWLKKDEMYVRMGKFFGKLLAITFAIGVATGIVMEFQFGTNWAEYSKFVGDIFGAPLAAEGVFAFFLESAFLGLYLFGRDKVSKGVHWFSALMVAVGSTISAFWILVANSWQQTPAGFVLQNGRAELTSFWEAVFNPSTLWRFFHTVDGTIIAGAFFIAGIAAYYLLKNRDVEFAKKAMKIAIIVGLISSVLELVPFGHGHAVQVARTQPEKFAVIEGLENGQNRAPMVLFGIPVNNPPHLVAKIEVPGMLSWLAYNDVDAYVKGMNDFPEDEIPPFAPTFASFHLMVGLGMLFIAMMAWGAFQLFRNKLWENRWFLRLLLLSMPLPVAACQLGWIVAEVGRQPWIVYRILKTRDAVSLTVSAGEVLFSLVIFSVIYLLLGTLYMYLIAIKVKKGPDSA